MDESQQSDDDEILRLWHEARAKAKRTKKPADQMKALDLLLECERRKLDVVEYEPDQKIH